MRRAILPRAGLQDGRGVVSSVGAVVLLAMGGGWQSEAARCSSSLALRACRAAAGRDIGGATRADRPAFGRQSVTEYLQSDRARESGPHAASGSARAERGAEGRLVPL